MVRVVIPEQEERKTGKELYSYQLLVDNPTQVEVCLLKVNIKILMKPLYPLKFHPILKNKIWGGQKLQQLLNKPKTDSTTIPFWRLMSQTMEVITLLY